jgi:hypothetical protein
MAVGVAAAVLISGVVLIASVTTMDKAALERRR